VFIQPYCVVETSIIDVEFVELSIWHSRCSVAVALMISVAEDSRSGRFFSDETLPMLIEEASLYFFIFFFPEKDPLVLGYVTNQVADLSRAGGSF